MINILIVDDHAAMRTEVTSLLEKQSDLNVVGVAEDGTAGITKSEELKPDVILMDVVMPGMNGIEAVSHILKKQPKIKILALSNHTGPNYVKAMLDAGAKDYLAKDHVYEKLVPAIRTLYEKSSS